MGTCGVCENSRKKKKFENDYIKNNEGESGNTKINKIQSNTGSPPPLPKYIDKKGIYSHNSSYSGRKTIDGNKENKNFLDFSNKNQNLEDNNEKNINNNINNLPKINEKKYKGNRNEKDYSSFEENYSKVEKFEKNRKLDYPVFKEDNNYKNEPPEIKKNNNREYLDFQKDQLLNKINNNEIPKINEENYKGNRNEKVYSSFEKYNNSKVEKIEKNKNRNVIDYSTFNEDNNNKKEIPEIKKNNNREYLDFQKDQLLNKINNKNEIIFNEIFFDGNSDNYDMILDFSSFEQLKKDGWTANFSKEGYKKYKRSFKDENNQNIENIVIGIVGIKNRGKSFLLKRILDNKNYKPKDGFLVTTHGISCGFPILEDNEKSYQPFITLDTAGKDNPLLQSAYPSKNDIKSIVRDQKVCEILLSDFIIKESNILIAVVEQLSFAEQEMLRTLIGRLKQKEVDSIEKRKLIVIHNLMNIKKLQDIEKFINEILLKSLTFSLEKQFVEDHNDSKFNLFVYNQTIENNANSFNDNKLRIVHLVVGNDDCKEVREKYNEPAFKYIRDYIKIDSLRSFDILESFKKFIIDNSKKFMSDNYFTEDSLEIGEKQEKKVYIDKDKQKPPEEKIIIPIKSKNKIDNINLKSFYFASDGMYYFSNSIEPLYSACILTENENLYLEVTFEMFGIIEKENLECKIDYDEKEIIIIEIKGKNKEFDIIESEEPIEELCGNLKYTDFDFQVQIDKYLNDKFEIEIKEEEVIKKGDDENGIYSCLFPIQIYDI